MDRRRRFHFIAYVVTAAHLSGCSTYPGSNWKESCFEPPTWEETQVAMATWLSPQYIVAANIAILAGMLATGVVEEAQASSSSNMTIGATVQPQCSFGTPTAGAMTIADKMNEMSTANAGGAAGSVVMTYSGGLPTATITFPTAFATSPVGFSATPTITTTTTDSQVNTWTSGTNDASVTPKSTATTDTLVVSTAVSIPSGAFTNGTYTLTYTITCQ